MAVEMRPEDGPLPWAFAEAVIVSIEENGAFEITLERSGCYVLLLIDSEAPLLEQIVGYVALGDVADTLLLFPGAVAIDDVDAGAIEAHGSYAYSEGSLERNATSFSLSLELLREIARTDDLYRTLKTVYINGAAPLLVYGWGVDASSTFRTSSTVRERA